MKYTNEDYLLMDKVVAAIFAEIIDKAKKDQKIILADFRLYYYPDMCIFEIAKKVENVLGYPIYINDISFFDFYRFKKDTKIQRKIYRTKKKDINKTNYISCNELREKVAKNLNINSTTFFRDIYFEYYAKDEEKDGVN